MATGADWRVGDAEREAVAGQLREHYAVGRLSLDEFLARLGSAYAAVTTRDLARVTADLPHPGAAWADPHSPGGDRPHRTGRSRLRRRHRAGLVWLGLLTAVVAGSALIVHALPHGALLLLALLLLLVPVVLLTALAATAIWVGRRAWRSGAWLELLPAAAGAPWLGRVVWLARALLVGRAFWRLGGRLARPLRSRSADASTAYAQYQDRPGGAWHQARVGDLSGTTR
jgi:DUF1707 SHOCT-like domain